MRIVLALFLAAHPAVPRGFGAIGHCTTVPCDPSSAICQRAKASKNACTPLLLECPVRFSAKHRAQAKVSGVVLTAEKYHQVQLAGFQCADGGVTVPTTDAGWPLFGVKPVPLSCARKPTAAAKCARTDGGDPGEDVMQANLWVGAECVRTSCYVMAGDP